jgi:hypothetical protein
MGVKTGVKMSDKRTCRDGASLHPVNAVREGTAAEREPSLAHVVLALATAALGERLEVAVLA